MDCVVGTSAVSIIMCCLWTVLWARQLFISLCAAYGLCCKHNLFLIFIRSLWTVLWAYELFISLCAAYRLCCGYTSCVFLYPQRTYYVLCILAVYIIIRSLWTVLRVFELFQSLSTAYGLCCGHVSCFA